MFKSRVAFSPERGLAIGEFDWDLKLIIEFSNSNMDLKCWVYQYFWASYLLFTTIWHLIKLKEHRYPIFIIMYHPSLSEVELIKQSTGLDPFRNCRLVVWLLEVSEKIHLVVIVCLPCLSVTHALPFTMLPFCPGNRIEICSVPRFCLQYLGSFGAGVAHTQEITRITRKQKRSHFLLLKDSTYIWCINHKVYISWIHNKYYIYIQGSCSIQKIVVCHLPVDPSLLRPFFFLPASVQASSTYAKRWRNRMDTNSPAILDTGSRKYFSPYTPLEAKQRLQRYANTSWHKAETKEPSAPQVFHPFPTFACAWVEPDALPRFCENAHPTRKIASSNIVSSIVQVVGVPSQSRIAFDMLWPTLPKNSKEDSVFFYFFLSNLEGNEKTCHFQNSYRL